MMYVRFPLSLRNVEDLLHERGLDISYETVRFWWNRLPRPGRRGRECEPEASRNFFLLWDANLLSGCDAEHCCQDCQIEGVRFAQADRFVIVPHFRSTQCAAPCTGTGARPPVD